MTSYVVVGMPKTGTSALYAAIKQEGEFVSIYETFNRRQLDYLLAHPSPNKLTKVLTPRVLDIPVDLDAFDRQLLTVRDPRDVLISWLLYRPFVRGNHERTAFIEAFVEALRRKEADPASISVRGLYRVLDEHRVAYTRQRDFRQQFADEREVLRRNPQVRQIRYEDFVDGRLDELADYLGVPLRNRTSLGRHVSYNERSKSYGAWRQWFTDEDVRIYRPLLQRYIVEKGYDPDWELAPEPSIDPATSSEHVVRHLARLARSPESTGRLLEPERYDEERIAVLESAVADGRETAMVELALAYRRGYGVSVDLERSRELLLDAAARGSGMAARHLATAPARAARSGTRIAALAAATRRADAGALAERAGAALGAAAGTFVRAMKTAAKRATHKTEPARSEPLSGPDAQPGPPSAPSQRELAATPEVTIGPGSHRARVRRVQELVNRATSHKVAVDGIYGDRTREGVAFLQRRLELPPNGIADPLTLALAQARLELQQRLAQTPRSVRILLPTGEDGPRSLHLTAPRRLYIPSVLEREGLQGYEPETLAAWLAALELLPQGHAVDIGANVGVFALLAAATSTKAVTAFEPTPELAAVIRTTAAGNALDVAVEEVALGAETGFARFYLSDVTDASNSLSATFRRSTSSLVVPVETLDEWCARRGCAPILLKVDTETTEPDVLRGALGLLRERRTWVICEVLPNVGAEALTQVLQEIDYEHRLIIDEVPFERHDDVAAAAHSKYRNWLFTPEAPPESYWDAVRTWRRRLAACGPPLG